MILRQEKTKGFSLIELVIVVSLLSLLATITVPHFQYYLKKKQQAECDQIAYQIRQLFVEYILE
ncbi:MAG: prepilin-type N-terminal cleavage/methylation domain-containing protein, partial [Bacilli bacterium]|nr:prepilin-type N-terminal cleavage/methylation domain-containing protein [Bacilli bacterium]